jgi:hypothetical protein
MLNSVARAAADMVIEHTADEWARWKMALLAHIVSMIGARVRAKL